MSDFGKVQTQLPSLVGLILMSQQSGRSRLPSPAQNFAGGSVHGHAAAWAVRVVPEGMDRPGQDVLALIG